MRHDRHVLPFFFRLRPAAAVCLPSLVLVLALVLLGCPPAAENGGESSSDAVLLPVPDDPTITFMVWFDVGSQNDPPGKEGLASLTASLIAQGATQNHSYEEILEELYPLAASYSTRVDKEMTTLRGRTHVDNIDAFFTLLSDAYLRPAFTEDDFSRLKSDQLNYLEKTLRYASDEELGKAALALAVFEGTPYAHPISGTVSGLQAITLDDVKGFYESYYTRENAVVALGGGYTDAHVARFEASLAELPEGAAPADPAVEPAVIEGREALLVQKSGADASISFGFPISVRRGDRDFYALWIANSWLGEHRSSVSHLYSVIREERGMNYGDYSYIEAFPEGGFRQMPPTNVAREHQMFEIWIRTLPNEQAHFALRAAMRELEDLVDNGMSQEEFDLSQSFLSKYYLHFAETNSERLGYAVDDRFYGLTDEGHLERFGEMVGSITREEVNEALQRHLQYENLRIAIVTGDAEAMTEALTSDAPSPMKYASPKSEAILEEDKDIEAFPLGIEDVRIIPVEEVFN